jgi:hypothetical protein
MQALKPLPSKAKQFLTQYPLLAPITGSLLLVAGGAGIFWLLTRSTFTPGTMPTGANIVPQDALLVLTVSTEPDQWRSLRRFGTPKSQQAFDQTLAGLRAQIFTSNGLDYETDIQHWVGSEITVAQLSPQSELAPPEGTIPNAISPQPMVAVLPIRDPLKAKSTFDQPRELPGRKWSERKYKDIQIREAQVQDLTKPLAALQVAVLNNNLLVIANSSRSIEQAIDTYRDSKKSLAATPGYSQALGQVQTERPFLSLYRNIPASITSAATNLDQKLSSSNQDWVKQSQGWTTVATLESNGITLRNIAWLKPDSKRKFTVENTAKFLPDRLPAETIAMFSGSDFQQFWADYRQDYFTYPIQPINPDIFSEGLEKSIGMSWEKDFLSWMKGEFALGLVPSPDKQSLSVVLMAQASDRRAAESALKKLDAAMSDRKKQKVETEKLEGVPVTSWSDPATGSKTSHGWLNDNVAFLVLGPSISKSFIPVPPVPLGTSAPFKQATNRPETPVNGHFYTNFDRTFSYPKLPIALQWLEPYRPWLDGIESIGLTAVNKTDRSSSFNIQAILKRGQEPGPLPSFSPSPSPSPKPSPKPSAKP